MPNLIDYCVKYEVDRCELLSRRRGKLVAIRRKIARELRDYGLSYPQIGKILNRHHTSIMHLLGAR